MFAGRVAQNWLQAAVTRVSSSSSSSSSSRPPLEPLSALTAGFQQLRCNLLHTTSSCCQAEGSTGSSAAGTAPPSSSPAGDSSASPASETDAIPQHATESKAPISRPSFATVPQRSSGTGYPESFLQTAAQQQQHEDAAGPSDSSSSATGNNKQQAQQRQRHKPLSAGVELPPEVLRVPLTQETKQEQAEVTVDAYSLSWSLVGEAAPGTPKLGTPAAAAAAAEQQVSRDALTAADKEALEKLVGILTKDGKKSRARRLLLDAMHIIQQQLAQGKGAV